MKGIEMWEKLARLSNRSILLLSIIGITFIVQPPARASTAEQPVAATNRPMRDLQRLVITVGQDRGDLRGTDHTIIQAGVEYLNRLGGGTLHILPGVYDMRNSVFLRPNITLRGSGEKTVLKKAASVVTPLVRDSDWFEYGVQVRSAEGFEPGGGVMLRSPKGKGDWQFEVLRATVTAVDGDIIYLDRLTGENFWIGRNATAATIFPILTAAENADDVVVEDIVLDGNRGENEHINGNFAGGVFIQSCNRWRFNNVTSRNYNGDGFSFQVCDDIQFQNCRAINNAGLGFHPGSGSQRPVFRNCESRRNSLGLFFCWAVSDGIAESCTLSENKRFGISIGHRDTDNRIRNCTIERNGEVGILFRREAEEFRCGNRNLIEDCVIRDNGTDKPGVGVDIQGKTEDITIRNTRIENTSGQKQKTGVRISADAERVVLQNNTFKNCHANVEDLRSKTAKSD
ncbi:MAG: right-handed parallel beta-helix repeat-containing protein [Planctomycetota bacterium]|jgi:parallel beta-helix repeat protein